MSISAWLPSGVLAAGTYCFFKIRQTDGDFERAAEAVTETEVRTLVVLLIGVLLLTTVTQAFEFAAIRFLEGYWGHGWLRSTVSAIFAGIAASGLHRARTKRPTLVYAAFLSARQQLIRNTTSRLVVDYIEADILDKPNLPQLNNAEEQELDRTDWRLFASHNRLRRLDALDRKLDRFPREHRILPTRLGNTLRAREDEANAKLGGSVQGMIQRVHHLLPEHLQIEVDQDRNRLGLYASLVLVLSVQAVLAVWIVCPVNVAVGSWVAGGALLTSMLFYRAATASAEAYGALLVEIATLLKP